jgi:hypothetical protein
VRWPPPSVSSLPGSSDTFKYLSVFLNHHLVFVGLSLDVIGLDAVVRTKLAAICVAQFAVLLINCCE